LLPNNPLNTGVLEVFKYHVAAAAAPILIEYTVEAVVFGLSHRFNATGCDLVAVATYVCPTPIHVESLKTEVIMSKPLDASTVKAVERFMLDVVAEGVIA
jgi:hypothetical protein